MDFFLFPYRLERNRSEKAPLITTDERNIEVWQYVTSGVNQAVKSWAVDSDDTLFQLVRLVDAWELDFANVIHYLACDYGNEVSSLLNRIGVWKRRYSVECYSSVTAQSEFWFTRIWRMYRILDSTTLMPETYLYHFLSAVALIL